MGSKYGMTSRGSGRRYLIDENFDEGDVWSAMENMDIKTSSSSSPKMMRKFKDSSSSSYCSSSSSTSRGFPSTPRLIPRSSNQNLDHVMVKQASASMMIPERRRMIKKNGVDGSSWVNYDGHGMNYDDGDIEDNHGDYDYDYDYDNVDGDGDGDDGGEVVPPHEYIARRLAKSQISSFSVCEGIGRTLKGRDLSHVRNTILRKTGFLES